MCRLGGIIYNDKKEAISTPFIASVLYDELVFGGPHSWGWASFNETDNEISWFKTPGRSDSKAATRKQLKGIDANAKWIIFHTRYATHGSPQNNLNNHPIPHNNIIGIHNGVLRNHEEILKETGREDDASQVDSEAIFAAVNKWGLTNGLKKVKGDMVAVFADARKPSFLYIARSHGRQVTLGWTERGNIIFASDLFALKRLEKYGVKFVKFSTVSENRLLTLKDGKVTNRVRFAPVTPKPVYVPGALAIQGSFPWERDYREHRQKELEAVFGVTVETTAKKNGKKVSKKDQAKQDRASRRGQILFPARGRNSLDAVDDLILNGSTWTWDDEADMPVLTEKEDLYWFKGVLLDRREYEDALLNPHLYGLDS